VNFSGYAQSEHRLHSLHSLPPWCGPNRQQLVRRVPALQSERFQHELQPCYIEMCDVIMGFSVKPMLELYSGSQYTTISTLIFLTPPLGMLLSLNSHSPSTAWRLIWGDWHSLGYAPNAQQQMTVHSKGKDLAGCSDYWNSKIIGYCNDT
jgi:hypothetical protein